MNRSLPSSSGHDRVSFDTAMAVRASRRLPLRLDRLLAGCVGMLTFALGLYSAGNVSLWYDETFSVGLALQPWHVLWHYAWGREANMALYYALLHVWLGFTSTLGVRPTELVVRLPSVACAAIAASALFLLGRRLLGRMAALVATALYAVDYLQLYAAHQARAYSLELLLVVIGWYALCAALLPHPASDKRGRQGWWVVYVVAMTLAVYAHLFGLLVWAAQAAAVMGLLLAPGPWRSVARAGARPALLTLGAVPLLALPMLADAALHGGASVWVPPAHPRDVYAFLLLLSGTAKSLALLGIAVALALIAAWLHRLPWIAPPPLHPLFGADNVGAWRRPAVYVLLCWLLGPIVLSYVTTQQALNLHLFYARYLVVVVPALCLLAAMGATAPRPWLVRALLAALLVVTATSHARNYYATAQSQDFRTPALWLQSRARPGNGIICAPLVSCAIPLDYYLRAYPGPARLDAGAPGRWSWAGDNSTPLTTPALAAYARTHRRIFLVDATPGSAASAMPRRWFDDHGHLVARFTGTTVTIRLYALFR